MASKGDDRLFKDGKEGFSTFGNSTRRPNHGDNQAPATITDREAAQQYGGWVIDDKPVIITSQEAAQRYGGRVIGGTITSDEAVQLYGAKLIRDRGRNNYLPIN